MSRSLRLIFAVTTMLGAAGLPTIASAGPKQAMPKPAPKIFGVKVMGIKIAPKGPMGVKITPKPQPVFVHNIPVFIPGHPVFIPGRPHGIGGYRPYGPGNSASYASAPGPSYTSAPAATYQALGLAWNNNGAWVVEPAATLDEASANALTKCNDQYGSCEVSAQSVSEQAFACLAVARSADDTHRLFAARAGSQDAMQAGLVRSMSDAGTTGSIEYAACNAGSS